MLVVFPIRERGPTFINKFVYHNLHARKRVRDFHLISCHLLFTFKRGISKYIEQREESITGLNVMTTNAINPDENKCTRTWEVVAQRSIPSATVGSTTQEKLSKMMPRLAPIGFSSNERTECQHYERRKCHCGSNGRYGNGHSINSTESPEVTMSRLNSIEDTQISQTTVESDSLAVLSDRSSRGRTVSTSNGSSFPLRSGAADCQYYLKTGKCNYGSRCKFNHPFRDENLVNALNRRDCFDFVLKGTCPYGKTCKYNHPPSSENILSSLENQSSSSTDFVSLPHSVSRPRHKRSASEPRCPVQRDSAQEGATTSQHVLVLKAVQRPKGGPIQIPFHWETSLDSTNTMAKRSSSNIKSRGVAGSFMWLRTAAVSGQLGRSPWAQSNYRSRTSEQRTPISNAKGFRQMNLENLSSMSPSNVDQESHLNSVFIRSKAYRDLPHHIINGSNPTGLELPCERVSPPNDWVSNSRAPRPMPFKGTPISISYAPRVFSDRMGYHGMEASGLNSLQTPSIWRNDYTTERREAFANAADMAHDFGRSSRPIPPATNAPPSLSEQGKNRFGMQKWASIKESPCRAHGMSNSTSGRALPMAFAAYSPGTFLLHENDPQEDRRIVASGQSVWNAVPSNPIASSELEISTSEMQRLHRHREQLRARQQPRCSQSQTQEQGRVQQHDQMLGYSRPLASDHIDILGIGKAQEAVNERQSVQQIYQDLHHALSTGTRKDSNGVKNAGGNWHSTGFDPMGYMSLLGEGRLELGGESATDDVWKPTEKTSVFGHGLFEMKHHQV